MAQSEGWRRYLETGTAFPEMTGSRGAKLVRELVTAGDVQRDGAEDAVEEVLDRSRKSAEALVALTRTEVRDQLQAMGVVPKGAKRPASQTAAGGKKAAGGKGPA